MLFTNSIRHQTREHCIYWRNPNRKDGLSVDELRRLSEDLGHVENLNLLGGEPLPRPGFAEIRGLSPRNNRVRRIPVPTNASFPDRAVRALEGVLCHESLQLFSGEPSLDAMPAFHNTFRGMAEAFERAIKTYDALAALQRRDPRLRIHAISTVASTHMREIRRPAA